MLTFALGDIQGCARSFERLFGRLEDEHGFRRDRDRLWLVGDLVNRGPRSLQTLRAVVDLADELGERLVCVLGNHDLHLLGVAAGVVERSRGDTLDELLAAPDRERLLRWLAARPLLHREVVAGRPHLLVHAGLLPGWSAELAAARAAELQHALRDERRAAAALGALRRHRIERWDEALRGEERLSALAAVFTRLRCCTRDGRMCLSAKGPPASAPPGCVPWFEHPDRGAPDHVVVCGHWAALGLHLRDDLLALDSGCVWGGELTALCLQTRAVVSQANVEES